MKNLLSIGQFAKLCETTTDTLIHYEEIGLLRPSRITHTNRRLYDIGLYHTFHVIHTLSESGHSLSNIQALLLAESETKLLDALKEKEALLQQKLNNLQNTLNYFQHSPGYDFYPQNTLYGRPFIQTQSEPLLLFATLLGYPPIHPAEFIDAIHFHKNQCDRLNLYPFPLGFMIQKKSLFVQNNRRILLYSPFPTGVPTNKTPIQSSGEYAVILHKGSFDSINDSIELLYKFISDNHYAVASDTYVTFHHNSLPDTRDSFYLIKIRFCRL